MKFKRLKFINGLLSNPKPETKDIRCTMVDLLRTPTIYLSHANTTQNKSTQFWSDDYQLFDFSRYYLGLERSNKTRVYKYPNESVITNEILPFFQGDERLEQYLLKHANQHNFLNAARTEVNLRLLQDGFSFQTGKCGTNTFEFVKQTDGSFVLIESYSLNKSITNVETGEELTAIGGTIATVSLKTKIQLVDENIIHTIESFGFEPKDYSVCAKLLEGNECSVLKDFLSEEDRLAIESEQNDGFEIIEFPIERVPVLEEKKAVHFSEVVEYHEIPDFIGEERQARKPRLMLSAFNAELKNTKLPQERFDEVWGQTFERLTEKGLDKQQEKFDQRETPLRRCK